MTTEERLEKLERDLLGAKRRNRWLLAAVCVGGGLCVVAWMGMGCESKVRAPGTTIRARVFILEDENGKTRGGLAVVNDLVSLSLYDDKGNTRAAVSANKDGSAVALHDEEGERRAALGVTKGGPQLTLWDEKGKYGAWVRVDNDGSWLGLYDENGEPRAALGVTKDGPGLELADEKGKRGALLGVAHTQAPDGKTLTYPESSLLLFGPDGKVIWQAP